MRLLILVVAFIVFADMISRPPLLAVPAAMEVSEQQAVDAEMDAAYFGSSDDAACTTDSECMELCPEEERNLPPDHPDYCDGGPQDGIFVR